MPVSFSVPIIYWKIELNFVLLSMTDACTEKKWHEGRVSKENISAISFLGWNMTN